MSEDEYWDNSIDWSNVPVVSPSNIAHATSSTIATAPQITPQTLLRTDVSSIESPPVRTDTHGNRFTSFGRSNAPLLASVSASTVPQSTRVQKRQQAQDPEDERRRRRKAILEALKDSPKKDNINTTSSKDRKARILQMLNEEEDKVADVQGTESPGKKIRGALSQYEEELDCPVCFDLFIAPRLLNPCGHSVCGDCIKKWLSRSPRAVCPSCRTPLSTSAPHLPNYVIDNTVQKHIKMLRSHNDVHWSDEGLKWRDRMDRIRQYEESNAAKPKVSTTRTAVNQGASVNFGYMLRSIAARYGVDDEEEDSDDDYVEQLENIIRGAPRGRVIELSDDEDDSEDE